MSVTPRVAEALVEIEREPTPALAGLAGLAPDGIDVAMAALLAEVRDTLCEYVRTVEELTTDMIDEIAVNAEFDHPTLPGAYLAALRLASKLRPRIAEARAEECRVCGGTGVATLSAENARGVEVDWDVDCRCGGA